MTILAAPEVEATATTMAAKLRAIRLFFFMAGLGMSTWAIIAPTAKIRFDLNDGTLGLILLVGGAGGVLAMPLCSLLIARFGSRMLLLGSGGLLGLLLPALSLAPSALSFTLLLFCYGLTFGGVDVAMNAQAAMIETQSGDRQMSLIHGCFSFGGLVVALATSLLLRESVAPSWCAALTGLAVWAILPQARYLLPARFDPPPGEKLFVAPNRATVVLGLCCFACFLTEGAATDWSTIFLRFSRGMPLAAAALGYAGFATMMVVSRVLGDWAASRLGAATVMRLGCALAAAGMALTIALPFGVTGILGFALVGLGIGNVAPLIFSAAGRVPGMAPSISVPSVVGLGYVGFLTGPVVIGLIAHRLNLPVAFGLDAALLFATFFMAEAVAA